ncbi:unnamed protein product [Arabidopsis halleri]
MSRLVSSTVIRVMTAGRQLAKSLESHSLNDLGFSKRF